MTNKWMTYEELIADGWVEGEWVRAGWLSDTGKVITTGTNAPSPQDEGVMFLRYPPSPPSEEKVWGGVRP